MVPTYAVPRFQQRYLVGEGAILVHECLQCGSVVTNLQKHLDWHQQITVGLSYEFQGGNP